MYPEYLPPIIQTVGTGRSTQIKNCCPISLFPDPVWHVGRYSFFSDFSVNLGVNLVVLGVFRGGQFFCFSFFILLFPLLSAATQEDPTLPT